MALSMTVLVLISTTMMIFSLVCLSFQRKHLLNALLSLEMILLSLFIFLVGLSSSINESFVCLVLLSFGACEAAVGLALLVVLVRTHGNDYVYSFSVQKC
uniref:NADH-ubiquinone oxidoreductase chain 4L n=1 Tax=Nierstraszella lineata TaxID=515354 RepID=A0A6H1PHF7_9MOLL|nr:NADH dehydrogenase subunit 4L [Nierstraszella lineata]QIZ12581.1 NADH dehydrogenase subunit 4L [Nierstraszella lineata]